MPADSPSISTLTISPLVAKRKSRDYFQTPPNVLLPNHQNQRLSSRLFSSPSASKLIDPMNNNANKSNSLNSNFNNTTINSNTNTNPEDEARVDDEEDEEIPMSQADKLRLWRHDALLQHHYSTAIYIGDKVLSLTSDPNDAFWLAQVHYSNGNYQIARNLMAGPKFEDSVSCRYLTGLCLIKLEKFDEALDIIGEINPFKKDHSIKNSDGGIKLEASMCYLRGLIFSKQNNFDRAKECYKEAVLVDVKCFEAFNELINNHLLTPEEEWDLLNSLNFDEADNNNELVKLLYTTRLSKYKNIGLFEESEQRLKDEYGLTENLDIMLSRADLYFIQCKFQLCLDLCEKIIAKDELNLSVLPNYLGCLHELGGKNKLFLMAHKLAENYPNHYMTWLAIGIYYFSIKKTNDARIFFSKASILNPNFGPAWVGFAHTFSAEGEHEQAISAYATASRLFPGIHLPNLFLGMQYLQMNNLTLSHEYLSASYSICPNDPLLLNELGVLFYNKNQLSKAESFFQRALTTANNLDSGAKSWSSIHCNLAHVYRKQNLFDKSLDHFNKVLRVNNKDVNVYSAIGLIYLKLGKDSKAIEILHIALSIQPNDPIALDLLDKALESNLRVSTKLFLNENLVPITATNSSIPGFNVQQTPKSSNFNEFGIPSSRRSDAVLQTPISKSTRNLKIIGETKRKGTDLDLIVEDLKRGEDSSDDDDDDAIMEVESD